MSRPARNIASKLSELSILDALAEPGLLGGAIRDPESWAPWRAFVASAFGLPMAIAPQRFFAPVQGALSFLRRLFNSFGL
jgi:hypothetical protein